MLTQANVVFVTAYPLTKNLYGFWLRRLLGSTPYLSRLSASVTNLQPHWGAGADLLF